MGTNRYAIGVDYGTLSARAVLLELSTGREVASSVFDYPHGVMSETLPDGTPLGVDWALEHPTDYMQALENTVRGVMADIDPADVVGLGIDFTACTMLPTLADGTPLCLTKEFEHNPNAWIKLWKHHAAQGQADRLNALAKERGESFLTRYGGKISSEWMLPKIMQILEEAPEVYEAAAYFVEAADWVIWQMTGTLTRNTTTAGYKAIWHKKEGFPSKEFFKALDPRMEDLAETRLSGPILPQGARAGLMTAEMAGRLGLLPGTAVAVANVDAHVTLPALGITGTGDMLMIMGTSTCHVLCDEKEYPVQGMCGVVEDGVFPGLMGYEAGQSCVGDHFDWFVKRCMPEEYAREARERGISPQRLLGEKAAGLKVGESGLIALDWWNGNRSVLVDVDLTGLILGCTLATRPEEMYLALMEATAFGTRRIIESFTDAGVKIDRLFAAGGIAKKDALMMQIYADVTGREIFIGASNQAPAVGSAMFGAVAAGKEKGGYDSIFDAAKEMGRVQEKSFRPRAREAAVYDELYQEYKALHDLFGRGGLNTMKHLKALREAAKRQQ